MHSTVADIDVRRLLRDRGLSYIERGAEAVLTCPICHGGNHHDRDTFAVNLASGAYNCLRGSCGARGSFRDLQRQLGAESRAPVQYTPRSYTKPSCSPISSLSEKAIAWFAGRGITRETLARFNIGQENGAVVFPFTKEGVVVNRKRRTLDKRFWQDKGAEPVLYLRDHVPAEVRDLIIVEGEIDALTLHQLGFAWCVSVPDGASNLDWIEQEWPWLERFETIYLGLDNDTPGELGAEKVAQRLGRWRCRRVRWAKKDPNDCLQAGLGKAELEIALLQARDMGPANVRRAEDYIEEMLADERKGIPSGFPVFDRILGGLRPGEVTVWTGRNGEGKTTILNQLALNLVIHGQRVGIVSLEMRPRWILRWMVRQSGCLMSPEGMPEFRRILGGRLVLLDSRDSVTPDELLESLQYMARRIGCITFIIDSLLRVNLGGGADWLERQRDFMSRLTAFAQDFDAHLHLVAHPRKSSSDEARVQKVDVAGSYDISNLAFNVVSIRRVDGKDGALGACLEVLKNRELGRLGAVKLEFDEDRKTFREVD